MELKNSNRVSFILIVIEPLLHYSSTVYAHHLCGRRVREDSNNIHDIAVVFVLN